MAKRKQDKIRKPRELPSAESRKKPVAPPVLDQPKALDEDITRQAGASPESQAALLAGTHSDEQRARLLTGLQQTHGNAYVQRLVKSPIIQTKLTVSSPDDTYEQEADRVAESVQRQELPEEEELQTKRAPDLQRQEEEEELMQAKRSAELQRQTEEDEEEEEIQPKLSAGLQRQEIPEEEEEVQAKLAPDIQRQAEEEEEEEEAIQPKPAESVLRQEIPEEEEVQAKTEKNQPFTVAESVEAQIETARGSGQPLDTKVQASLETRLGHDFSQVRVHTDDRANSLSRQLNAEAFTTGRDVFFRGGNYQPDTTNGQGLIAHELTHVVQQGSAPVAVQNKPETPANEDIASIQKKPPAGGVKLPDANGPSVEVPDLKEQTVIKAKVKIKAGEFQAAIDLIVADIGSSKMPRLGDLNPPNIQYDASETDTGGTYYLYDANTNTASDIEIKIGKAAFASVPWLYSTIMHEYKHAVQMLTDPKKWNEKGPLSEFQAYTWEILHARDTGVIKDAAKMQELWDNLLSEAWDQMNWFEKAKNMITYLRARSIVKSATAPKK